MIIKTEIFFCIWFNWAFSLYIKSSHYKAKTHLFLIIFLLPIWQFGPCHPSMHSSHPPVSLSQPFLQWHSWHLAPNVFTGQPRIHVPVHHLHFNYSIAIMGFSYWNSLLQDYYMIILWNQTNFWWLNFHGIINCIDTPNPLNNIFKYSIQFYTN